MSDEPNIPESNTHASKSRDIGAGLRERWRPMLTVLLTLEVLVAIGFAGFFLGHHNKITGGRVTVSATGTIVATPDTVNFQIGFQSKAPSATAALNDNNRKIKAIEKSLLAHGIKKSDIQTTSLNLYQSYDNYGHPQGFGVDDTLSVTAHGVKLAGHAIGAAVSASGNGVSVSGVNFTVANTKALKSEARAAAMRHALQKASDLAKGGHSSLGSIVSITEDENQYYPVFAGTAYYKSAINGRPDVPLQPGNASVTVNVTVVYSLAH